MLLTVKGYKYGHHLLCEGGVYYIYNISELPDFKTIYVLLYTVDNFGWYALKWYPVYDCKQ